jgi:hypothetical protein
MVSTLSFSLNSQKSGRSNTRHYFSIVQSARGRNFQVNTSIVRQNTFPLNKFQNCELPVVFRKVTNKGQRVNDRCLVTHEAQDITCLIPKTLTQSLVSGMQVNVPIKNFLK